MALISCPECKKDISDKATTCPNCGYPIVQSNNFTVERLDQPIVQSNTNITNVTDPVTENVLTNLKFKPTKTIETLLIDEKNRLWKCGLFGKVMRFDDIIDVEIYENGSSITKTSTASMLGRAAVGAVLLNPLAAIVGGATAKKTSVDVVDSMQVIINTRVLSNPIIKIDLKIPKKTKIDSKDYAKAINKAQKIQATIRSLSYN